MQNLQIIPWNNLKVGDFLGSGSYGEVFKATWHGTEVAIKELHLKNLSKTLQDEFNHEAQIMSRCQFPHILGLYGICDEIEHKVLVIEYMPKGSLRSVLENKSIEITWNPIRWTIAIDIGKGLSYLHSKNILHRDLKSPNILLTTDYQAKIGDFGLSKIKLESSSSSTKNNKGTTRWIAPELLSMDNPTSPNKASDVYSYGMVLWEISARELPFKNALNDMVATMWIANKKKETIPSDCPKEFADIITETWLEANSRPSAEEVTTNLIKSKPEIILDISEKTKPYVEKSWHFDPTTERKALLDNSPYQLLDATNKDFQKAVGFYQHHPVPGYEVGSVKVIYNRDFNQAFELQIKKLQQRENNPVFKSTWSMENNSEWRTETNNLFEKMAKPYVDNEYPAVKLLSVWHGTKRSILDSLFKTGYVNLATTDTGFFGNGYYGAHEAEYSYRVYGPGANPSDGVLILNWIACFSAYPVIDGDMTKLTGKTSYKPYDAHFVPVSPKNPNNPNEINYYPCKQNQKHTYTEIVIFESSSCLPRYLVELQSNKPQPNKLNSLFPPQPFIHPQNPFISSQPQPNQQLTQQHMPVQQGYQPQPSQHFFQSHGDDNPYQVHAQQYYNQPIQQGYQQYHGHNPFQLQPIKNITTTNTTSTTSTTSTTTTIPTAAIKISNKPNDNIIKNPISTLPLPLPTKQLAEQAKALYDYTTSQLSFKKGDQINILEKSGSLWLGEFKGKTGYVPSNFIQLTTEKKTSPFSLLPSPQVQKTTQPQGLATQKDLTALLKWVTEGHLIEVEKLLQKNPELTLMTGTITDLSDRTFNNITVFQYAAWALDIGMWNLILKCLDNANALAQLQSLEAAPEKYSQYGAHYDITPLVTKTMEYLDNSKWDDKKREEHWQKEVGGAQRQCPAWLIYAWCEEGYDVAWIKKDLASIQFTRQYDQNILKWWFTKEYNGGKGVGSKWAVARGDGAGDPRGSGALPYTKILHSIDRSDHDLEVSLSVGRQSHEAVKSLKTRLENLKPQANKLNLFPSQPIKNVATTTITSMTSTTSTTSTTTTLTTVPISYSTKPNDNVIKNPMSTLPPLLTKQLGEQAKALYDYTTLDSNQLSFKKGDPINILEKPGNWWLGEFKGKTGYVPSNFIQLTTEKKTSPFSLMPSPQVPKTTQPQDLATQKDLTALLKWVTEGHLIEVEKLLQKNSNLALMTGTVTDLSDRTFNNITVFQYALWALDIEMWDLILKYLDNASALSQLNSLETNSRNYSQHGAHYDITPLMTKTKEYINNYNNWSYEQRCQYWQKEVGGAQRQCPAWLIYAWCEKGGNVAWVKTDLANIRVTRQYDQEHLKWWFTHGVGSNWAALRGKMHDCNLASEFCQGTYRLKHDLIDIESVEAHQYEAKSLKNRLENSINNSTSFKYG